MCPNLLGPFRLRHKYERSTHRPKQALERHTARGSDCSIEFSGIDEGFQDCRRKHDVSNRRLFFGRMRATRHADDKFTERKVTIEVDLLLTEQIKICIWMFTID